LLTKFNPPSLELSHMFLSKYNYYGMIEMMLYSDRISKV